jgi:predicted HAD superfamily Cof-like phosphohydrolase
MENPIKRIVQFNQQAGLIEKGYDDFLESSFQIEEALEGLPFNHFEPLEIDIRGSYSTAKDFSRAILKAMGSIEPLSDVDRLDKACDAVVFAVGSMAKLGLNAQQVTQALNIVMNANFKKLGAPKDEHGKQLKPDGWTGPEAELQTILDKRG